MDRSHAFSVIVIVALYVAAIAAVVVGAFRFFTQTQLGRRLGGLHKVLDPPASNAVLQELQHLRAEIADIQERLDVTEGLVARLSHADRPVLRDHPGDVKGRPS
jgi:hypothetical protein